MYQHVRFFMRMSTLMLILLLTQQSFAQVEPDTLRTKPELPTGPPMPVPQEQPRPKPRIPAQPPVQPEPEPGVAQPAVIASEEKVPLIDRLYWGGSFGLQFGTYTNISLLPILGYRATEKFSVGGGIVYHYIRSGGQSLQNYGGRAFVQHELLGGVIDNGAIVAHAEYELLSVEQLWVVRGFLESRRISVGMPMAGLGYRQRISDRASFDLLVLYNFNEINAPYSNPVIRAGFNIPFRR